MYNVSKINEATAQDLAKKDQEVFVDGAVPPVYITYPEVAVKHLPENEYENISLAADEAKAFSLVTYHYISYDESSYIVRDGKTPFPDNETLATS